MRIQIIIGSLRVAIVHSANRVIGYSEMKHKAVFDCRFWSQLFTISGHPIAFNRCCFFLKFGERTP